MQYEDAVTADADILVFIECQCHINECDVSIYQMSGNHKSEVN